MIDMKKYLIIAAVAFLIPLISGFTVTNLHFTGVFPVVTLSVEPIVGTKWMGLPLAWTYKPIVAPPAGSTEPPKVKTTYVWQNLIFDFVLLLFIILIIKWRWFSG